MRKRWRQVAHRGLRHTFSNPHRYDLAATHVATHNKDDLHVLRRTYAAVRDVQVVECMR